MSCADDGLMHQYVEDDMDKLNIEQLADTLGAYSDFGCVLDNIDLYTCKLNFETDHIEKEYFIEDGKYLKLLLSIYVCYL